jgi:hypothetical protein
VRTKRWPWVLAAIVALLWVAKYALLDTASAASGEYVIDVDALHRVATATGPLPQAIEVEKVGDFAFPRSLVVAGEGFRMHPMVLLAHRVVWPDHSILIDTAMSPEAGKKMPGSHLDAAAFERVEAAIAKASAIVFTHEHVDHVGGVAAARDFSAIAPKVRITSEQLSGPRFERDAFRRARSRSCIPSITRASTRSRRGWYSRKRLATASAASSCTSSWRAARASCSSATSPGPSTTSSAKPAAPAWPRC